MPVITESAGLLEMDTAAAHDHQDAMPTIAPADTQKRLMTSPPQDSEDWKRQRTEPSGTAVGQTAPSDPRLIPHSTPIGQNGGDDSSTAGQSVAHAAAIPSTPADSAAPSPSVQDGHSSGQGVATDDLPVVEALVRREGTDKFKRFPFDPTMNAEQRAERVQVCLHRQVLHLLKVGCDCETNVLCFRSVSTPDPWCRGTPVMVHHVQHAFSSPSLTAC